MPPKAWLLTGALALGAFTARPAPSQADESVRLYAAVKALLKGGVPSGIVLGLDENLRMAAPPATDAAVAECPDHEPDRAELVSELARRWGGLFVVSDSAQVVSITSPRASICTTALDRRIKGATFSGRANQVFFDIATIFDESLRGRPPRGLAGSYNPTWANITQEILFETSDGTLRETLDRFVWAAPGLAWYGQESCPESTEAAAACRCMLGFMTGDSIVGPTWDACVGLSCPGPAVGE